MITRSAREDLSASADYFAVRARKYLKGISGRASADRSALNRLFAPGRRRTLVPEADAPQTDSLKAGVVPGLGVGSGYGDHSKIESAARDVKYHPDLVPLAFADSKRSQTHDSVQCSLRAVNDVGLPQVEVISRAENSLTQVFTTEFTPALGRVEESVLNGEVARGNAEEECEFALPPPCELCVQ